jgi:hypothetical protein
MTNTNQLPDWLRAALYKTQSREPYPVPDDPEWPIMPVPGEVRAARPTQASEAESRLVLIVATYPESGIVSAALTTSGGSESTEMDVRLDPEETGVSFPLTIETDVVSPLWFAQLGPRLTQLRADLTAALAGLPFVLSNSDPEPASESAAIRNLIQGDKRGLPTRDPSDPLWQWKKRELDAMRRLSADCLRSALEETRPEPMLDLAVLSALSDSAEDPWTQAQQALSLSEWAEEPDNVRSFEQVSAADLPEIFNIDAFSQRPFGLDIWNALEPIREQFLHETKPSPRGTQARVVWHPTRKPMLEKDQLPAQILSCLAKGKRSIRLMTLAKCWDLSEPSGVLFVDVDNVRLQILPDFLENRSLEAHA